MRKSREFDNVLDECLERLLIKGETIEQCLRSFPEYADALKPLLETSLAVKEASAIQPRPEFRAKARYQFHSALQGMEGKRSRLLLGWLPQWATVVTIVLIFLLVGGGVVAAAGNSMPDNPLYPVKLATEQVRLTLTPSALGKAELYANLADKRVAEIVRMAGKDKPEQVERTAQRLNTCLVMVANLASAQKEGELLAPAMKSAPMPAPAPSEEQRGRGGTFVESNDRAKLRKTMAHYAVNHPAALRAVLETAPGAVKPALLKAIAVSEVGYQRALKALD